MPNTKQRCFPKMCFSAGWQCYDASAGTPVSAPKTHCKCVFGADSGVPAEICQGPLSCTLAKERQPQPVAGLLPSLEQGYWAGSLQERSLLPARTCGHCLSLGRICALASAVCKAWWAAKTSLGGRQGCLSFSPQSGFPSLDASSNVRNVRHMTGL